MQNISAETQQVPSWASIAAGLVTIIAALVLLLFFSIQLSHQGVSKSTAPQVQQTTSVPSSEPDRGALVRGPR